MINSLSAYKQYEKIFEQYLPTRIVFGDGAFVSLNEEIILSGAEAVSVIFGGYKSSMESGAYRGLFDMFRSLDLNVSAFQGVPAEPDFETVQRIISFLDENSPQLVIAVGGGSVMDAAKVAYASWQTGMSPMQMTGADKISSAFPDRKLKRVICIPTTSGTGSEVTPYQNIVHEGRQIKYIICDSQIVPELALVEPALTCSMSEPLTISTALDALTHSVESFLNIRSANICEEQRKWAVLGMKLVCAALPKVLSFPNDIPAREMLSAAAVLGGMSIKNYPTSLPHLCSFSMSHIIPHGYAVALTLPACWKYYLKNEAVRKQTMKLAGIFPSDAPQKSPEDVVDAYVGFLFQITGMCGIQEHPSFSEPLKRKIVEDAVQNSVKLCSAPNPVSVENAKEVLMGILSENMSKIG